LAAVLGESPEEGRGDGGGANHEFDSGINESEGRGRSSTMTGRGEGRGRIRSDQERRRPRHPQREAAQVKPKLKESIMAVNVLYTAVTGKRTGKIGNSRDASLI
jgi:hypothetical protein